MILPPPSHFCQAKLISFIKILLSRKASSSALTIVTLSGALKARSRTGLRRASRAIFYFVGLPPYKNAAALFFFTIIYTFEFSARLGKMTLQNYFCKVILPPPPHFCQAKLNTFLVFFTFLSYQPIA